MWRILFIVPVCALTTGCCSPTTTGWRFEVGKPGTINTAAAVQQTSGVMAISPIAAFPAEQPGRGVLAAPLQADCQTAGGFTAARYYQAPARLASPSIVDNCTLDEACRRIDQLERSLSAQAREAERLRMPRTP